MRLYVKTKGTIMSDFPILFTPSQVARIMGISRSQVYILMNKGQLDSVHIGRCRRITKQHIDNFIESLQAA